MSSQMKSFEFQCPQFVDFLTGIDEGGTGEILGMFICLLFHRGQLHYYLYQ